MSIKQLPEWAINQNHPAFYDLESKTAIEMSAQLHGKMNEVIGEVNKLEEDNTNFKQGTEQANAEWKETTESAFRQEFQDFIDTVDLKVNGMQNEVNQEAIKVVNEEVEKLSAELETEIDNTIQAKAKELQGTTKKELVNIMASGSFNIPADFNSYRLFTFHTTSIYYGMAVELLSGSNQISIVLSGDPTSATGATGSTFYRNGDKYYIIGAVLKSSFDANAKPIATITCFITELSTTGVSYLGSGSPMNVIITGYNFISEVET